MIIPCPYCGDRDYSEFRYGGDAGKARPGHGEADPKIWHDYVFVFANPRGAHTDYWQHVLGCRQWITVARDTATLAVTASWPARQGDR